MSFPVFFMFSSGLAKPLCVPKGTKQAIMEHVEKVEKVLGLKRVKYEDNPTHWDSFKRDFSKINNDVLCSTVIRHNNWVRAYYDNFGEWAAHPVTENAEQITPEDAQLFWHGFETLDVPPEKWSKDYYRARMEHLYEVMRGRESEGVSFDEKPLTPKQAAAVVRLFEEYLDPGDLRLDVPKDRDYLASSYDGGYEWCEKCGAITPEDADVCAKKKCPLRAEREAQ